MVDQYQKALGVDLWNTHYERMQEQLKKLKDVNRNIFTEMRQRMGESLDELSYEELGALIEDVDNSVKAIRERKFKVLSNQIDTHRKKQRNVEEIHRNLLLDLDARQEDPHYGLVDNGGDYSSVLNYPRLLALRLQPTLPTTLHSGGGSDLTTFTLLE
ncbi:OLC1v1018118C1 [Oldenlandia corymbosa var. corymbosa]|uniref:OLC1v1018118C1 n=1 Tax=Oldenlandia corymbosa var. corymbosa TaxID=529605 RepID=A0AAV1EAZ8_OLDCO|nr:OLC1v1018118C1 [Oldenlandia corymbosa var. corymbosa]